MSATSQARPTCPEKRLPGSCSVIDAENLLLDELDRRVRPSRVSSMFSPPVIRLAQITAEPLSVDRLLALVSDRAVGGVGLFVGVVRDVDEGSSVVSLDYTAHPTAESAVRACAEQVAARHEIVAIAVQHRIGHLDVGDLAVVVAVGAVHRGEALAACRELIDAIKATVPIWKEQEFASGRTDWVGLT